MYRYMIGYVREIATDSIVLENGNIGYHLFVAHPEQFRRDEIIKVFLHLAVREDQWLLYGFLVKEERDLFLRLIDVSGIGPRTAINVLSHTSPGPMIQAIETGNTAFLKKLPGIGPKAAQQIILDLKGKLVFDEYNKDESINRALDDTKLALKSLGFKANEIDRVCASLGKETLSAEEYLRKALQQLKR